MNDEQRIFLYKLKGQNFTITRVLNKYHQLIVE